MGLAGFRFRTTFGRRWRSYLAIAVLLGVLGGVSMFAVAAGRRTQSAYPRFVRSAAASTMAIDAGPYDAELEALVSAMPQVQKVSTYIAFNVLPVIDGKPDLSVKFEAMGSLNGRFFDQDRFTPTTGRRPDPGRPDEVAMNEFTAKQGHYQVGQSLDLGTYAVAQVRDPNFFTHPSPPKLLTRATIVGIGLFTEEVLQDESDASPLVLLTPAYTAQALPYGMYSWQGLVLKGGDADVDAVKKQYLALLSPGSPEFFRVTSVDTFHALRATRPLSIALALFGVIAGLAALVLVGQAISRMVRSDHEDRAVLRALGGRPGDIMRSAMVGPVLATFTGAVLAVAAAIAMSPAAPIGRVRKVEVAPGAHLDLTVLGIGAAVLVALLVAVTAFVSWHDVALTGGRKAEGRSTVVAAASSAGMSPAAVTGLRLAFEPGTGRTAVPTRSVMGGAAIAVAALVASLTFGTSLHSLVANHRLYGWNWDATYEDRAGYGNARLPGAHAVLDNDPGVESWSAAYFGSDLVNGRNVPLLGMAPGSSVLPPIVRGRGANNAEEVVLGATTAAQLRKDIGDEVSIGTFAPRHLRVVGIATLPTIGIVHGAHTSLGSGALVAFELVPGFDRNVTESTPGGPPPTRLGPNAIFIRFRQGVDAKSTFARLKGSTGPIASFPGTDSLIAAQRPAEIVNTSDAGGAPSLLAGALSLGAVASLGLALVTSVRRRFRDLALLKALGFNRRQISATVAWQATATISVGLFVGLPVGIALGRESWSLFAKQLDVVPKPSVPVVTLLGLVLAALVMANLVAAVPAGIARRVRPGIVLRSE